MAQVVSQSVKQFKGLRNDEDSKQIGFDYLYKIKNFNYPTAGLLGLEKILMPKQIQQIGTDPIDGIFEYRFLDSNNALQTQSIVVTGGAIYSDVYGTALKSGLSTGYCDFAVFGDRLYIANGKNYIQVYDGQKGIVKEMGAPYAEADTATGNPNGTYYYAMTYTTSGGEEVLGSVSNSVTVINKKIVLTLPVGYSSTISRNIYRTTASGNILYYIATINDNTTLTYTDDTLDSGLSVVIPDINNELPKPYHITVSNEKIFGGVVDKFPTQLFSTEQSVEVLDAAQFTDIANYGNDNTPIKGLDNDFGKVIVGTEKNIVIVDPSNFTANTVVFTRAGVGIKNGYTVRKMPAFQDFPGGLIFVSTLNDVRVMSGLQAVPVATSLDNVSTTNWAQAVRGTLEKALKVNTDIYAEFFDYKYHLVIANVKYVFDIRTQGWTVHEVTTDNYQSQPKVLGILGGYLYNGQPDGWIEKEYAEVQYRGEDVEAYLESPHIAVDSKYKQVSKFILWFIPSKGNELTLSVTTDDNIGFEIKQDFVVDGGIYNSTFFNTNFFDYDPRGMDYRAFNINRPCRWLKYRLTNKVGNISYQGFEIQAQVLKNKE